ncbi:hypothetical protein ACG0Z6_04090 [Roseateles sp. BYS180W]|uniref:Uncharacterized protein n=1 Tax=Roseateles rivi TaxID=3299028 RepID=A0ABW7FSX6_9BURK
MSLQTARQPSVPALLLALLLAPAAQAERPLWYECQGMTFGYVLRQGDTIDFYNRWFNCPRLRITGRFDSEVTLGDGSMAKQEVLTVDNRGHEASCPYRVMALAPIWFADPPAGPPPMQSFEAYGSLEEREQEAKHPGTVGYFSCASYSIGTNGVPQLIRPEGPHGRSIREQKMAIAAAIKRGRYRGGATQRTESVGGVQHEP